MIARKPDVWPMIKVFGVKPSEMELTLPFIFVCPIIFKVFDEMQTSFLC